MKSTLLAALIVGAMFIVACSDEPDTPTKNDDNNNNNGGDPVEICDTLDATYNTTVSTIINNNCTNCHGGNFPASNIDLTTYENVKTAAAKENFLGAVKHEDGFVPMPYQLPKLSDDDIQVLDCWVQKDFPEM